MRLYFFSEDQFIILNSKKTNEIKIFIPSQNLTKMKKILFLLFLSAASLFSYAQPGSLDVTFGTAGIITTSFGATTAVS